MKTVLLALVLITSQARAAQVHLRCQVTSVFTQFFSEARGDRPGFYSAGQSAMTTVEYVQQIGSQDLACVTCAQARWKILSGADAVENARVVKPGDSSHYGFPSITLMTGSRAIVSTTAAFISNGKLHLKTSRTISALKSLKATASVEEKLSDALAPDGSPGRLINSNQAELRLNCIEI